MPLQQWKSARLWAPGTLSEMEAAARRPNAENVNGPCKVKHRLEADSKSSIAFRRHVGIVAQCSNLLHVINLCT